MPSKANPGYTLEQKPPPVSQHHSFLLQPLPPCRLASAAAPPLAPLAPSPPPLPSPFLPGCRPSPAACAAPPSVASAALPPPPPLPLLLPLFPPGTATAPCRCRQPRSRKLLLCQQPSNKGFFLSRQPRSRHNSMNLLSLELPFLTVDSTLARM